MYVNTIIGLPPKEITRVCLPESVQRYARIMTKRYKEQPIVAANWPPRVGHDFFGRLALVEKKEFLTKKDHEASSWHLLRGEVDKIPKLPGHTEIEIENILQPDSPGVVVIDGPPGIGKTTLCRKILEMWSNGTLVVGQCSQYNLVLYCPLRRKKIANGNTLADLLVYKCQEVAGVVEWMEMSHGEGLLIIFDGWDELSKELRQDSLPADIIRKEQLAECSVIVTSRSYASTSLLKMDNCRHIQIIGFSKEEISKVIIQTLQKDPKLAQELIDENKGNSPFFKTTQSNEDSQLAVKLINDLKVRDDVRSLCYIPLVCSMVILVYSKEGGHLPTTLTQLYENFILQTVRRHVEIRPKYEIDPYALKHLSSLPPRLAKPLQEMCKLAYTNLVNAKMIFSSSQLQHLLCEAVKEEYLGLMTTFREYDEEKHQFLHLTIQEFLAAWWIAKHEKTEQVFEEHFDDDHFRMCLRFVAGLTHLKNDENYRQYFNKQNFDFQPPSSAVSRSTGNKNCFLYASSQCRIEENFHNPKFDNRFLFLVQILHESQNSKLCEVLAQCITNSSLSLSLFSTLQLFDILCISYFIHNSSTTWNYLELSMQNDQELSIFTDGLTSDSQQIQCKKLVALLYFPIVNSIPKLLKSSNLNIQECNCNFDICGQYFPCLAMLDLFKCNLKVLCIKFTKIIPFDHNDSINYIEKCSELEKCVEMNATLQEINIRFSEWYTEPHEVASIIRGMARNMTAKSFSLAVFCPYYLYNIPDGIIEQFLRDNKTLQTLSLNIPNNLPSLNLVEVNTPLAYLNIEKFSSMSLQIMLFFHQHTCLEQLILSLDTSKSATKLFNILQTNETLKSLTVEMKDSEVFTKEMGTSLQNMLEQNKTLKCFNINEQVYLSIPYSFLCFLTNGLRHNTSLQQLRILICPLITDSTDKEKIRSFFNVLSQKNLTDLQINFYIDSTIFSSYSQKLVINYFYEVVLRAATNLLQSHNPIKHLWVCYDYSVIIGKPYPCIEEPIIPNNSYLQLVQSFYEAIFCHPSLEYIGVRMGHYNDTYCLKDFLQSQKEQLIVKRKKKQILEPPPQLKIIDVLVDITDT